MAKESKRYDTRAYYGAPTSTPLWHTEAWLAFAAVLDPIVQACHGKPRLVLEQYDPSTREKAPRGRIGWSEASHRRWTHGSSSWDFESLAIYVPSLEKALEQGDTTPDLFLEVRKSDPSDGCPYSQLVLLAVSEHLEVQSSLEAVDQHLRASLHPLLAARTTRQFYYAVPGLAGLVRSMDYLTDEELTSFEPDSATPTVDALNRISETYAERTVPVPPWERLE